MKKLFIPGRDHQRSMSPAEMKTDDSWNTIHDIQWRLNEQIMKRGAKYTFKITEHRKFSHTKEEKDGNQE